MEAITREEKIMSGESLKPITRKEMFLAKAAGQSVAVPEPKTREEFFLSRISGGGGAGGSAPVVRSLSVTENGTYSAPYGVDGYNPVQVNVQSKVEPITITENGTYNPPSGVDGYAPIVVNVESAGGGDESLKYIEAQYAEVSLPNATTIKRYAFSNDTRVESVDIPNVTAISQSAFQGCTNLLEVRMPNIQSLDTYAFYGCKKLILTHLPAMQYIGQEPFTGCDSITELTLGGKPGTLHPSAFRGCKNLVTINVPWAEGEVYGAPWGATNATINYNYTGA